MNTFDFMDANFAVHMGCPGDPETALRKTYVRDAKSGPKPQRTGSTWFIVRANKPPLVPVRYYDVNVEVADSPSFGVVAARVLANFDTPTVFITIGQRGFPLEHCFVTYDTRNVRICSPERVDDFDFTSFDPAAKHFETSNNEIKSIFKQWKAMS